MTRSLCNIRLYLNRIADIYSENKNYEEFEKQLRDIKNILLNLIRKPKEDEYRLIKINTVDN